MGADNADERACTVLLASADQPDPRRRVAAHISNTWRTRAEGRRRLSEALLRKFGTPNRVAEKQAREKSERALNAARAISNPFERSAALKALRSGQQSAAPAYDHTLDSE
jgi:hypothetical protein